MRIDFTITYRGETLNLDETASQMVVAFTLYDGNFPNSSGGGAVDSVNGKTGAVVLNADDIAETSTRKWLTATLKGYYDSAYAWVNTNGASVLQSISDFTTAIANRYTKSETDTLLSSKADLVNGLVPASQLPSFVDDVLEYANIASFPTTGADGKIYITLDTNKTYRWTGSTYASLDEGIVLGETSSTAYRGDRGKESFDLKHSHSNKTTLDAIEQPLTTALKTSYDDAVTKSHTHSNKSTLDLIEQAFTTALKSAYDSAVTNATTAVNWIITNGSNILYHLSNTNNPHATTPAQIGARTVIDGTITTATLTGTTAETSLGYITITGGSLAIGKDYAIESFLTRPSGSASMVARIRVSSSATPASISSETLMATLNISSANQGNPLVRRNIKILSATSTKIYPSTTSVNEDNGAISASLSDLNIDHTVTKYYHLTVQPLNSADSISPYKLKLIY